MTEAKTKKTLTRSQFLGLGWFGAGLLFLGEATVALLNFIKPIATSGFGGEVYAGKVAEFTVDSVNRVLAGRFFIVRTSEGMLALWQKCTHLGCSIPWAEAEGQFHCPCHGSLFNRYGEVTGGPAPRPMDTFPITIKNMDEVWVDTGKPTQRSSFDPEQLTRV